MCKHAMITDSEMRLATERALLRMPFLLPAFGASKIVALRFEDDELGMFESVESATGYTNCKDLVCVITDGMYNAVTGAYRVLAAGSHVAHELAHIGLGHALRTQNKAAAEEAAGRKLENDLWNIALDFECDTIAEVAFNDVFRLAKRVVADGGEPEFVFEKISLKRLVTNIEAVSQGGNIDTSKIPLFMLRIAERKHDAEAIYDILVDAVQSARDRSGSDAQNVSDMLSAVASARHMTSGVDGGSTEQDGGEAADARTLQLMRDTLEALGTWCAADKSRGKLPQGIRVRLKELSKPPVSAVTDLVNFSASNVDARKRTWRRLHRPSALLCGGVAPGSSSADAPSAMLVLDTSGSVGDEDMAMAIGDYKVVCDTIGAVSCEIVYCDTEVQRIERYSSSAEITAEKVQPTGRGGTSFVPPFEMIVERERTDGVPQPDILMYVTDLVGGFPTANLMRDVRSAVMWCGMRGANEGWSAWETFKEACPDKAHFVNYYDT